MPIVNGEGVLGILDMYRLIWISGRFGGHKTALAFQIAKRYLEKGYRLITNSRCVWADDWENVELDENDKVHAVIVFDEGGLYFKSGRQVEQIAAYAAKMDCVYIFPSFFPPTTLAQIVNIQPVVSLKATGLPVIIYKWTVKIGQFKENGWFFWWNPKEIYGIYSRQDPGEDPEAIVQFLSSKVDEYRKRYGRKTNDSIFALEEISEGDQILEAAQLIAQSNDELGGELSRSRRRRRI